MNGLRTALGVPRALLIMLALGLATLAQASEPRYLALGDSYTIGESVTEAERYPNQLADSLALRSIILTPVDIAVAEAAESAGQK